MSILVINDNTMLLSKIVNSLLKSNHTVRSASSIREARQILTGKTPQVLCLDLLLPDGNGLDFLQELRESGQQLPVVIIAGHYSDEHLSRAKQLGVSGFFSKPFALQDLHSLLNKLLNTTNDSSRNNNTNTTTDLEIESNENGSYPTYTDHLKSTSSVIEKITLEPIPPSRIAKAKRSFTTRRVLFESATHLKSGNYQPQVGDLVLARVDKRNQQTHLQLPTGRRSLMFVGDEIIICYGNRYAPDQYEAEIPHDLSPCHLVAAGGIAAKSLSRSNKVQSATRISPLGVLSDADGRTLNLNQFKLEPKGVPTNIPPITAVIGTAMNAGKTTTVADFILGMTRQGLKVGAAKITGTGAGGDIWRMVDAGCHLVLDFVDCGLPTTYKVPINKCTEVMETLIAHLCDEDVDAIVIEIADGILQAETQALIQSPIFSQLVDNIIFAAGDALGALGGVTWLKEQNLNVIGISGVITSSPLAMREYTALSDLAVFSRKDLNSGQYISNIIGKSLASAEPSLLNKLSA